jgi:hypothetical protein
MTHTIVLGGAIAETQAGTGTGMTNEEIKAWLHKCAASCREYDDHIMAECYEATLAQINELETALDDLMSWFPDEASKPKWELKAGEYGADDAVTAARAALAKAKAVK